MQNVSRHAARSLQLRISECERQMLTAHTSAERLCLAQTIADCLRQLEGK